MSNTVSCRRCNRPLQAGTPDPNARAIRQARSGGHCPNCAVTYFIRSIDPMRRAVENHGVESLRLPHIQQQMVAVLKHTQLTPGEIDWETVIAQWELPWK